MSTQNYTISQAAKILGVSAVTLRLWERQGKITSSRTAGGQRRYSLGDLEVIRQMPHSRSASLIPEVPAPKFNFQLSPSQKRVLLGFVIALVISTLGFSSVRTGLISLPSTSQLQYLASIFQRPTSISTAIRGAVLASQTALEDLRFTVNVPALFNQPITAPNIIYSLTAGDNITITPGQRPTISATDQTTALSIFKTIKVGTTTFDAGSKTDTLTFAAGDNASVSINTSDKKITFSATTPTASGWTDDGSIIRLTTAGDLVSIGSATGAAKLSIESNTSADLFTASQSGNLLAKLDYNGLFNLAATGFNAGLKLQNSTILFSGAGAPSDANGSNGDYYFRTDGTGNTSLYTKVTGSWIPAGGGSTTLQDAYDNGKEIDFSAGAILLKNGSTPVTTLNVSGITTTGIASVSGQLTLASTGTLQTTNNLSLTLGGNTTGNIILSPLAGAIAANVAPSTDAQVDLGTAANRWRTIYAGNLITGGSGTIGLWQRALGVVSPDNITDDLTIGGTSTASAKIALNATTGQLVTTLFKLTTGGSAGYFLTSDASGVGSWTDISTSGTAGPWTLSGSSLFPDVNTYNLLVGSALVADDIGKLTVSGSKAGKALVVLNTTNTDQDILTASASGVTKFTISNAGNVGIGTTAPDAALEINHATGDSLRLTYNDPNGSATDYTDLSLSSTGALTLTGSAATLGASATAEKTFLTLTPGTITLTAPTAVTSLMETAVFTGATIAADAATTVNKATAVSLTAPVESTNVTLTDTSAARVLNTSGTPTNQYGLYIEDLTAGATADYGIYVAGADTYSLYTAAGSVAHIFDAAENLAIDAATTDNTTTAGVIDLNIDTITTGNIGLNIDHIIRDSAGITAYGAKINQTIDDDTGESSTGYGLYIAGTNNDASSTLTALYVDAGTGAGTEYAATFMNGNVGIGTTGPDAALEINHATGDSLRLTYNDSNGSAINFTDFSLDSTGGLTLTGSAASIASATSAEKTFLSLTPATITLTGTTQVTSLMDTYQFNRVTIAGDTASVTVDDAATLTIAGPPAEGTNVILTEAYALKINTAATTATTAYGLFVEAPTGAGTNIAAVAAGDTEQLRLTRADTSIYTSFTVDASGNLTVDNSGTNTTFSDKVGVGTTALVNEFNVAGAATVSSSLALGVQSGPPVTCNAANEGRLYYSGTAATKRVYLCDGTTWIILAAGTTLTGGDSSTVISPEFPGAVISADGTNNVGTLTSDREATGAGSLYNFNYYEFASGQTSLQDYDVYVRYRLPDNFASWTTSNALVVDFETEDTTNTNNKVDVTVYKDNDADTVSSNTNVSNYATTWHADQLGSATLTFTAAQLNTGITWAAGDVMTIKIKLYSKDNYFARVGTIKLDW